MNGKSFFSNISQARYKIDDYYFDESSQGLGYTNMVYMHFQIEKFIRDTESENGIIHFFVVEEPEAHMHPQMQKVFMKYLIDYYKKKNIQGIVTTHSCEVVATSELEWLRVIRPDKNMFEKRICDIRYFLADETSIDSNKKRLYNLLYSINFADIIFADKIIMFEGDTERMYLKKILEKEQYNKLAKQYLSLIQVGGAYAHWYRELVEYLGIRTLILTDIDYEKKHTTIKKILNSNMTNGAILHFYKLQNSKNTNSTIEDLYEWKKQGGNKLDSGVMINFQSEEDGYIRTLEGAMLAERFKLKISSRKDRNIWKEDKKDNGLNFSIPKSKKKTVNLRQIIDATKDKKTDFMYSVLLSEQEENMLPNYSYGKTFV